MRAIFGAVAACLVIACSSDDRDPAPEPAVELVVRDDFIVEGFEPPPNPVTGVATPSELNATRVLRFRSADAEGEPRAIVVGMPGMWAGATSLEPLARALVRRSIDAGAPIEFWAIDRRSNLLEDLAGFEQASAANDPAIAASYYGDPAHFRAADDLSFMSEWGLRTHIEDARRVIARIERSKQRVILLGHSLGGIFVRSFAGYRFEDGTRGTDLVAGLVLVDSAPFYDPLSEDQYREGLPDGFAGLPLPVAGLDAIRDGAVMGNPFGADKMATLQVAAMRAKIDPDGVVDDPVRSTMLSFLLLTMPAKLRTLTNMTAFGLMFDDDSTVISPMAVSIGALDGPSETFMNPFTGDTLSRPSDHDATYAWIGPDQTDPQEATHVDDVLDAVTSDTANMLEWYFPARLELDSIATAIGDFEEDSYQVREGLTVTEGDAVDAPMLAIGTALSTPELYENARRILAPIGEGRPAAGATRDDERAYRVLHVPTLTHFDATVAADSELNPIPQATFEFIVASVAE